MEVEVRRIDDFITDDQPIDVMKIDVEGAEPWVIMGAERLLRRKQIKTIFFEQNKPRLQELGISEKDGPDFLTQCGYRVQLLGDPFGSVVEYSATI